jgi:selenocysteine lyase/cysteine desulfurase
MEQLEPPFIDLHSANWTDAREYYFYPDRRRFETWEYNIANKLGLSTAIRYAMQIDVNSIWQRIQYLSKMLRDELVNLPGLVVHDTGHIKSGIVTFSSMRVSAEKIFTALKADNMNVSICKKKYDQLNTMQRNLDHIVRASLHYYNTEEEINQFYQCIKKII